MNLKLETEFSKAEILQEVDARKRQIDDMRPLPEDVEGRVMQKLRLDWNYHSNAIEGNKLTYGETIAFLMEGITAKGKPLKDHLDIRGHNEAINFLLSIVKDTRPISEADIRNLHQMILVEPYNIKAQTSDGLPTTKRITLGEYKTMPNHVKTATDEMHYYAAPEETPAKMQDLMEWYSETSNNKDIHPVVVAALFHHKFVSIHPFDDGNGRLSRLLMNLILMQKGYPPVVIKMDDRQNYYSLLSRADAGESWPFVEYIAEKLFDSLQLFLKAAMGGDIDEDEDIDKEISLLKMKMKNEINVKDKKSNIQIADILITQIKPLAENLDNKAKQFEGLFSQYLSSIEIYSSLRLSYDSVLQFINSTTLAKKDEIFDNLQNITLVFSFKNFKKFENDFDIQVFIAIVFKEYQYYFTINNIEKIISKRYWEMLSSKEEQKITKAFIKDFNDKYENQINQKSPKS